MEEETKEERRRRLRRERARERYAADPEKERRRTAAYKAENPEMPRLWLAKNHENILLSRCRRNARARGHDCSLTLDDVRALVRPMRCEATGRVLSWEWEGPGANPWAPSIDRIDGSYGYHLENVRVVSWCFNRARGEWPDSIVMEMAEALSHRPR